MNPRQSTMTRTNSPEPRNFVRDHNQWVFAQQYYAKYPTEESRRFLARAAGRYFQHYSYSDEYSQN